MGEPVDPNYRPPAPFTPPAQRAGAQAEPAWSYQSAYDPVYPAWPHEFSPEPLQPPPPASHRRRNLVIVAVFAILGAAAVGTYVLVSGTTRRLPIPQSFDGYSQEHDATADQMQSSIRGMLSGLGSEFGHAFDSASVALYSADSDVTQKAVVMALPTSALHGAAGDFAGNMLDYMGNGVSTYAAGPHGGSLQCGQTSIGAVTESACAWSDATTTGMIVCVHQGGAPLTPEDLSFVALALRDKID